MHATQASLDFFQTFLAVAVSSQGKAEIEPGKIFFTISGKRSFKRLASLRKPSHVIIYSPHVAPDTLAKRGTIYILRIDLRSSLEMTIGDFVVADQVSLSS
jgi:hypothetical protein